jgi:hypothetical protein
VARTLQRTFASWRELGDNYLIGRQFWSLQQTRDNGRLAVEVYSSWPTRRAPGTATRGPPAWRTDDAP